MFKNLFKGKKLVTFDLDGTLIASKALHRQAYQEIFASLDIDPSIYEDLVGQGRQIRDILEDIQKRVGKLPLSTADVLTQICNRFLQKLPKSGLKVTEGFWDLAYELKEEKGLKLALVTNTDRIVAEATLSYLGIEQTFDSKVFGDEVKTPKPDPEIYKKVMAEFKVKPREVLAFEDSIIGAISAADSGADVVVVWDGETPEKTYPRNVALFIGDFADLVGRLDQDYTDIIKEAAGASEEVSES